MRYYVTVGERVYQVEVAAEHVIIDGEQLAVELVAVGATPVRRLLVNGQSHRLVADHGENKGEWDLHLDGHHITAEAVDERTRAIRAMTGRSNAVHGPKPVRAPMPGMIVKVEVQQGDKVKAGQGVIIIEAMKMENELKVEAAGTVARVLTEPGTAVEKGAILIEFESDD